MKARGMEVRAGCGMKFSIGKAISVELIDGRKLRGFVHAEDKGTGLICLELIPTAQVAVLPCANVRSVCEIRECDARRQWPSTGS